MKNCDFGELKKMDLRDCWPHEAHDFTPWLEDNIKTLGDVLGFQLEITEREAEVGSLSLDLLAKDLGSGKIVAIENQYGETDSDHLGRLLTYAAGYDAEIVVWIFEDIRDEYRGTFEWLNRKTDIETEFFAVEVEIFRIEDSKPAYQFKPVVVPNDWQKSQRQQRIQSNLSEKAKKYQAYFQRLIDELREQHQFTGARKGQPQNWYSFSPGGINGIYYSAVFSKDNKVEVSVYILFGRGQKEKNKKLFDALAAQKSEITNEYEDELEWQRMDENIASRIAASREGSIESSDEELEEIHNWHIENLRKIKTIFTPRIKAALAKIESSADNSSASPL